MISYNTAMTITNATTPISSSKAPKCRLLEVDNDSVGSLLESLVGLAKRLVRTKSESHLD